MLCPYSAHFLLLHLRLTLCLYLLCVIAKKKATIKGNIRSASLGASSKLILSGKIIFLRLHQIATGFKMVVQN